MFNRRIFGALEQIRIFIDGHLHSIVVPESSPHSISTGYVHLQDVLMRLVVNKTNAPYLGPSGDDWLQTMRQLAIFTTKPDRSAKALWP